jgi:hypothetical protein
VCTVVSVVFSIYLSPEKMYVIVRTFITSSKAQSGVCFM